MSKTIIISNRLPLQINLEENNLEVTPSVGGLATGLKSFHKDGDSIWIGWSGLTEEEIPENLLEDVKIYTIDKCSVYGEDIQDKTEQRLSYLSNIICLKGDSFVYLPRLVHDHPKEKIGIFIDGPKNREGTQLALESLRRSNVVFSACHDIMFQEDNTYCPNLDEEYIKTYSFLNKSTNNIILKENCYKGKTIGEYFPKGMGITFFYKDNKGLCVE